MKHRIWITRRDRVRQRYWVGRKRHYGSKLFRKEIERRLPPIKEYGGELKKRDIIHFFEKNPEYLEKTKGLEEIWLGRTTLTPKGKEPISQYISPPDSDKKRIELLGKDKIQKLFVQSQLVHELEHLKEDLEGYEGSTVDLDRVAYLKHPKEQRAFRAEDKFHKKKYKTPENPWGAKIAFKRGVPKYFKK